MNYVTGPLEEPPTKAVLKLSGDKVAKAHAETLATARAEKKTVAAVKQQKSEAAKKAQKDADRALAEELSRQQLAKAKDALEAETTRLQAEKEDAGALASTSQTKGIFIQFPSLDVLSEKVDIVSAARVKMVNKVDEVKTSIIKAIHNTVLSNKPDLSSTSH